jgi:hypothetical protein
MSYTIGIDAGGTFIAKAATAPADQSECVLDGIALLAKRLGLGV